VLATRAKGIKPLLSDGFGRVDGLFDRRGMARRMKQPNADGYYQRHHNDHPKHQSGDIRRAELSDACHNPSIIATSRLSTQQPDDSHQNPPDEDLARSYREIVFAGDLHPAWTHLPKGPGTVWAQSSGATSFIP
jgi:hypothetical protein